MSTPPPTLNALLLNVERRLRNVTRNNNSNNKVKSNIRQVIKDVGESHGLSNRNMKNLKTRFLHSKYKVVEPPSTLKRTIRARQSHEAAVAAFIIANVLYGAENNIFKTRTNNTGVEFRSRSFQEAKVGRLANSAEHMLDEYVATNLADWPDDKKHSFIGVTRFLIYRKLYDLFPRRGGFKPDNT